MTTPKSQNPEGKVVAVTPYVLSNYMPIPEAGCWLWLGGWNIRRGYGKVNYRGKVTLAHRLFYSVHKGPIPAGMLVCHKCDTPACVNPDHLFLGTNQDNCDDKFAKGRDKVRLPKPQKATTLVTGACKYRGVSRCRNKFRAIIEVGRQKLSIGTFTDQIEAAHAYNRAAVRLLGDQAILNPIGSDDLLRDGKGDGNG